MAIAEPVIINRMVYIAEITISTEGFAEDSGRPVRYGCDSLFFSITDKTYFIKNSAER